MPNDAQFDDPRRGSFELKAPTGIGGLDELLGGGLPSGEMVVALGEPGSGKTTLGMQFALAGVAAGERVLYLTMSETERELKRIASSHGWSLDGLDVHHHSTGALVDAGAPQTMLHPAEVELPEMAAALLEVVDRIDPQRVVVDSLSEMRMLARDARWYRRQIMTFKERFTQRGTTTLVLDERRGDDAEHDTQSIASGVLFLERDSTDYGPARRRLTILKMRGVSFDDGRHDMEIRTGSLDVFPRLVAAQHRHPVGEGLLSSGIYEMDRLLGGGLDRGHSVLLVGPTGTGKSTLGIQFLAAAAEHGERGALFAFDERTQTLVNRCRNMGICLERFVEEGLIRVEQVDPAEVTPGQFSHRCRRLAAEGTKLVMIDSLNGYFYAMPNDRYLALHFNELLNYLNQQGITVLATSAQHGMIGENLNVPIDVSFLADTLLLLRHFEFGGAVRQALSVHKRRGGPHERLIREMKLTGSGIEIGPPLTEFHGVLGSSPDFVGERIGNGDSP